MYKKDIHGVAHCTTKVNSGLGQNSDYIGNKNGGKYTQLAHKEYVSNGNI